MQAHDVSSGSLSDRFRSSSPSSTAPSRSQSPLRSQQQYYRGNQSLQRSHKNHDTHFKTASPSLPFSPPVLMSINRGGLNNQYLRQNRRGHPRRERQSSPHSEACNLDVPPNQPGTACLIFSSRFSSNY